MCVINSVRYTFTLRVNVTFGCREPHPLNVRLNIIPWQHKTPPLTQDKASPKDEVTSKGGCPAKPVRTDSDRLPLSPDCYLPARGMDGKSFLLFLRVTSPYTL